MDSAVRSFSGIILGFLFLFRPVVTEYQEDDRVTLWVNNVGLYNNPQETYNYYRLPFCHPSGNASHKRASLGEILGGNHLIDSQIDVKFKRNLNKILICELKLDAAMIQQFKHAIDNLYWFEFFLDDLPLWGFVGEVDFTSEMFPYTNDNRKYKLFTNKNFEIKYNGKQIIHVNLIQEYPHPIEDGGVLNMTYSVKWIPTNIAHAHRFDVYLDHYFFYPRYVHWFSILNSFVMIIFLCGLVAEILMRTLSNADAKCAHEEDKLETLDGNEESGWKVVHGDVFRPPKNLVLLSAVVGTGSQLSMLVFLVITLTFAGMLYIRRGAIITTFLFGYAVTSIISGYVSGGMYFRIGGEKWIKAMIITAFLFPSMCFGIGSILNTIAFFYGSSAAIPLDTVSLVFAIWALISLPLVVTGPVIGRNWSSAPNDPCPTKTIPRPIPDKKWFLRPSVISLIGGFFPFGSIFVELYFVFTSIWNYKVYYLYGVLLLAFVLMIIVTICVAIAGTYFLLHAENYHWQWTSFFSAASIALYAFLHPLYYYLVETRMSGFLQTSFYFGYTLMFCLGLGIMCGAVGYLGANSFVRLIYRNIKH